MTKSDQAPHAEIIEFNEDVERRLAEGFSDLVGRRDQRGNMLASAEGILAAPAGPFRVADVARASRAQTTTKKVQHTLDAGTWSPQAVRLQLLKCLPGEIEAVVLEWKDLGHPERCAACLKAAGHDWRIPLAWAMTTLDRTDLEGGATIEAREAAAIGASIEGVYRDLRHPAEQVPPLLVGHRWLGGNPDLISALDGLDVEYLIEIDPGYRFDLARGPYEPRVEIAAELELGSRPRALVNGRGERTGSFVCPGPEGARFLARPRIHRRSGLSGRRHEVRALELLDLHLRLDQPQTLEELRVPDFVHNSRPGWQRAAMLVSAVDAARHEFYPAKR